MKNIQLFLATIIFLFATSFDSLAQDTLKYEVTDNQALFSAVILVPNTTKEILFKKAKEWVYKTYVSGNAVIDIADPETSKINANGITGNLIYKNSFVKMDAGHFKYGFTIYAKDNKAKIVFDRIIHNGGEMVQMKDGSDFADDFPSKWGSFGKSQSKKQWILIKEQAAEKFQNLFLSFKKYLESEDKNANF